MDMFTLRDFFLMKASLYNLKLKYEKSSKYTNQGLINIFRNSDFILGEKVKELEDKLSEYSKSTYLSAVGNGTDALIFSLSYLKEKFPTKKNVITTPLSYLASTSSICLSSLKPVFCDIDNSLNLDPKKLEKLIDKNTLAVLFVHYSGNPTNIQAIKKICLDRNVPLIEDCAQSFGATSNKQFAGTFGFAGCVSLHPLKNLSCAGDGGFVMTQDRNFYEYLNLARNHGHKSRDDIEFWSYNSRLDTMQALITLSQFDWFTNELEVRRHQYKIYRSLLNEHYFPRVENNVLHSFNWLVILVNQRNKWLNPRIPI